MRNEIRERRKPSTRIKLGKIMPCFCSQKQFPDDLVHSSESLATNGNNTGGICLSEIGEATRQPDTGNIEEAETSLRENGSLNYEEARALLGRYEYQKGNIEAALHVFEGIDIASMTPKMKTALSLIGETRRPDSYPERSSVHRLHRILLCRGNDREQKNFSAAEPMSISAVSLLFEAIFLKAKSLQALGRYKEAAQTCSIILDIVESSLPAVSPQNPGVDPKMQETLNKAVELLPDLWKLADSTKETILSYRRALLHPWNLGAQITAKVQKEFAIFLLYSGAEAVPPNLRYQMDSPFVPKNNFEEAILLLIILLRKMLRKIIEWDPSILDHLTFALSISGGHRALANQVEGLLPGVIDKKEMFYILAICYLSEGDESGALELWKRVLSNGTEDFMYLHALLFASKICSGDLRYVEDGISFASNAVKKLHARCSMMMGTANYVLGIALSASCSRSALDEGERVERQSEAIQSLETAAEMTEMMHPDIVYRVCLENAQQRNLEKALRHAQRLVKLERGSDIRGCMLLSRILSAQRRYSDAETVVDATLDQCGVWDQGELLRTKAKLQIAQGLVKEGIETYSRILAVIQLQSKSFGSEKIPKSTKNNIKYLEQETWHDLASIYAQLTRWHDAELCIVKSDAICHFSASRWHAAGLLHEARSNYKEALKAYELSLEVDPNYVPSLVSTAAIILKIGCREPAIVQSYVTKALSLDRMNARAWYYSGLCKNDGGYLVEAAECFQTAAFLEETEPIEPFK